MSRIPASVVTEVYERASFEGVAYCEGCGATLHDAALHHRQARGMGGGEGDGVDVAHNLVVLHTACHVHIHAYPTLGRRLGLIVPRGTDPATVAVLAARDLLELVA